MNNSYPSILLAHYEDWVFWPSSQYFWHNAYCSGTKHIYFRFIHTTFKINASAHTQKLLNPFNHTQTGSSSMPQKLVNSCSLLSMWKHTHTENIKTSSSLADYPMGWSSYCFPVIQQTSSLPVVLFVSFKTLRYYNTHFPGRQNENPWLSAFLLPVKC